MATNEGSATEQPENVRTDAESTSASDQSGSSPLLSLKEMGRAARRLFGNWRALLVLLALYGAMLSATYFFISGREANLWQVLFTFLLALLVPALFFIIQVIGIRYVEDGFKTKELLSSAMRDFWKLLVVTLPLLLVLWLVVYIFGKLQMSVPAAVTEAGRAGADAAAAAARPTARGVEVFSWKEVLLTTLRALILYLVLPLIAIRLWISVAREGLGHTVRNLKGVFAHALAPGAVLVYAVGLLIFGVIPYFLITTHLTRGGAWTEISLLGVRLLLASLFMLFGWVITLGALSRARMKAEG
ncbi:MAG TPA: hypothetical protein VF735_04280 [Pyrinomonadaceae bacterium]|jgi:hypothetical protein